MTYSGSYIPATLQITINDKDKTTIPYNNRYLKIEKVSSLVVMVTLYDRIKIEWDGSHMVKVR